MKQKRKNVYELVAFFENEDAIEKTINENPDEILGVYSDPQIFAIDSPYCGDAAIADHAIVAKKFRGK